MKICINCLKEKDETEFYKDKSKQDGLNSYCKECSKSKYKDYYIKYYEKVKEKVKIKYENKVKQKLLQKTSENNIERDKYYVFDKFLEDLSKISGVNIIESSNDMDNGYIKVKFKFYNNIFEVDMHNNNMTKSERNLISRNSFNFYFYGTFGEKIEIELSRKISIIQFLSIVRKKPYKIDEELCEM